MHIMATSRLSGWEDVEPLPQDDGPTPVVAIAYTQECNVFLTVLSMFPE